MRNMNVSQEPIKFIINNPDFKRKWNMCDFRQIIINDKIYHDYVISKYGVVLSLKLGKIKEKKLQFNGQYFTTILYENNVGKAVFVHRLVAEAFIPNPENKPTVNHIDGNKLNNCDWNLEWATYSENNRHAYEIGLKTPVRGEDKNNSRLTEAVVRGICVLLERGIPQNIIASEMLVSRDVVARIKHGRGWRHISNEYNIPESLQHNVRITKDNVIQICQMLCENYTVSEISRILNISYHVIIDIKRRKTWKSIIVDYDW